MQKLMEGRKVMPATAMSDDTILVRNAVTEHNPDGTKYDVKPIFRVVEDALRRSTLSSKGPVNHVDDRSHHTGYSSMPENLSAKIDQISCEILCKNLNSVDARSSTVAIFEMLTMYNWDVKIVLVIAAFSLTYGEFWLLVHIHDTYQHAKSKKILKQLPSFTDNVNMLKQKPTYDILKDVVNLILEITKCIIKFHDLETQYIPQDVQAYANAYNYVPVACYWTVRSIVACAAQITRLNDNDNDHETSTSTDSLSTFISKLRDIFDRFRELLNSCNNHTGEKMDEVHNLLPFIFSPHSRNKKIPRDYIQPLYDGVTKKRVGLEPLRWKNLLLLFSGPEISTDELLIVEQIYNETKAREAAIEGSIIHELVWIPIVATYSKSIEPKLKQFLSVRDSKPWYSVCHPSLIVDQVISFIQKEWKYKNVPILVGLDPLGRVSSSNAIHMTRIWGSTKAYPFTNSREQALWQEENWRLELLVDGDDISNWIKDEKYIFLYGGDDIEWISKFVREARRVAEAAKISLEMIYVGKSRRRKKMQHIVNIIQKEKLSTSLLQDQVKIWLFWTRVESMFFSKLQVNQTDEEDHVMQEIKKLLIYDKQRGWILLAKGSQIVVTGHARTGLQTLEDYDNEWKEHADKDGFEAAFKNHYAKLSSGASPCSRFEVSASNGETPERLTCPECNRHMQVFTSIQCNHDGNIDDDLSVSTVTPPTI